MENNSLEISKLTDKQFKTIFGISILSATFEDVLQLIMEMMNENKVHILCDINVANLSLMYKNEFVANFVKESDIVVPDGLPIVWASKLLGRPLKQRIAGCDLFSKLIEFGSNKGYRFYLLGAKENVVTRLKNVFENMYPEIKIVGIRNGYFNIDDENVIVDRINHSKANVLILGFSSPKREEFIKRNKKKFTSVRCIQAVGGSFDVLAGYTPRAPRFLQRIGMEWFFRFLQEPRRLWKRYLKTNIYFFIIVLKELLKNISVKFKKSNFRWI